MNVIFQRLIKAQKVREDEFNIYVNKKKDGKVRKYDPRLDLFSRFKVKSFVNNNKEIEDYSVSYKKNKDISVEDEMKKIRCLTPELRKLRSTQNLFLFKELNKKRYILQNHIKRGEQFSRENFSAFNELEQKKSWYLYFVSGQNYIENFLLANKCNRTITLAVNHCVSNPKYDMQIEEVKFFPSVDKIGINTYCKHSGDKTWTYLNNKVMVVR